MSDIDFSDADLSKTEFARVKLNQANLSTRKYNNSLFYDTNWWDASKIDNSMLNYLVESWPPIQETINTIQMGKILIGVAMKSVYEGCALQIRARVIA